MSGKKVFVVLAVGSFLSTLGAVSAGANDVDRTSDRGGYVVPPSTNGVNPVHHHEYFGRPPNYACFERFKTYEASSGTYLGYDGRRHLCKG